MLFHRTENRNSEPVELQPGGKNVYFILFFVVGRIDNEMIEDVEEGLRE